MVLRSLHLQRQGLQELLRRAERGTTDGMTMAVHSKPISLSVFTHKIVAGFLSKTCLIYDSSNGVSRLTLELQVGSAVHELDSHHFVGTTNDQHSASRNEAEYMLRGPQRVGPTICTCLPSGLQVC